MHVHMQVVAKYVASYAVLTAAKAAAAPKVGTSGGRPFAPAGSWLLVKAASPRMVKTTTGRHSNILYICLLTSIRARAGTATCTANPWGLRLNLLNEPHCCVTARDVPESRFAYACMLRSKLNLQLQYQFMPASNCMHLYFA